MIKVGVLALQGAYQAHERLLKQHHVATLLVRTQEQLSAVDGLIIPGGESSSMLALLEAQKLFNPLRSFDKPIMGTCAGAILLAKTVLSPSQPSLARMDIIVERNAYGRQLESGIHRGDWLCSEFKTSIEMVFIRAPRISIHACDQSRVKVLASCQGQPVAVQQGDCLAVSFHPELTQQTLLHHYFIQLVEKVTVFS